MKNRILTLLRNGLMERYRVERKGSTPLTRFTISSVGEKALAIYDGDDPSRERDSS
ncbi:MAG: hypothetical protein H8E19_17120 [Deltaproteobacteria bacterium]|uniref:Uncharacterized protein n=1 Tax=Candidatus Desulfacyla euxinica TaxID=2841693 RepID=A0A8J6N2P5_9DELT|nr:hypothetical protein [Candidatus Desulfacyla euxinica]